MPFNCDINMSKVCRNQKLLTLPFDSGTGGTCLEKLYCTSEVPSFYASVFGDFKFTDRLTECHYIIITMRANNTIQTGCQSGNIVQEIFFLTKNCKALNVYNK